MRQTHAQSHASNLVFLSTALVFRYLSIYNVKPLLLLALKHGLGLALPEHTSLGTNHPLSGAGTIRGLAPADTFVAVRLLVLGLHELLAPTL